LSTVTTDAEDIVPTKLAVMGVGLTCFSGYDQAVATVERTINAREQASVVAINPEKMYRAHHDDELAELLNKADIAICDGVGAKIATRFLIGRSITRITGIALFFEIIRRAAEKGWKVFLLGASRDVNGEARSVLVSKYPTLNIVGALDGYFDDSDPVIEAINKSQADIVFVAMGTPKQEIWIRDNRDRMNASILMGVGGTFDVAAGRVQWAPAIFRRSGTEWLYRLIREPRRLKRQLVLPKFAWLMLKYKRNQVKL
jgi:N-acetylglucosaminyldiphosphoundecaprenol N-acetyl-beta-D-mannosaminyltransferase